MQIFYIQKYFINFLFLTEAKKVGIATHLKPMFNTYQIA